MMNENIHLNIIIPKKQPSSQTKQISSKQKRYENYINRKKKKLEKSSKNNSIQNKTIKKTDGNKTFLNKPKKESGEYSSLPSTHQSVINEPKPFLNVKPILKKKILNTTLLNNFEENENKNLELEIEDKSNEKIKKTYPSVFASSDFETLPINEHLKKALKINNYIQMTKIQQAAIPKVLTQENCVIKSETGSGKTLCYLVPIFNLLMKKTEKISREKGTFALILCPTRELCIQVDEESKKLLSKAAIWIVHGAIMGGESIKKEKARLRKGINILISTPGRLVYHLQNSASFQVNNLEFLILEESDRTLDMGFSKDIELIIQILAEKAKQWEKIQKILISANFTQKIKTLTLKLSPKEINYIGWEAANNEKEDEADFFKTEEMLKIPKSISQEYVLLKEEHKIAFCIQLMRVAANPPQKYMIFVATIDEVEYISYLLQTCFEDLKEKYQVFKLHGDIDQKTRSSTYMDFKKKNMDYSVLIATDVASRGLDFNCVDITILTSVPPRPIDYCNSIGRTGRIDKPGLSILLLYHQEINYLEELKKNGIETLKSFQNFGGLDHIRQEIVSFIKGDPQIKIMAKRAYVSFMRAYNRNQKGRFFIKALNLQGLAKNFGIGGGKLSQDEEYKQGIIKRKIIKEEHYKEKTVKKNVIKSVKDLERMEFG